VLNVCSIAADEYNIEIPKE